MFYFYCLRDYDSMVFRDVLLNFKYKCLDELNVIKCDMCIDVHNMNKNKIFS